MKFIKIILTVFFLTAIFLVYSNSEEWTSRKGCQKCEELKLNEMQYFIGTILRKTDYYMIFIEQKTAKSYKVYPCDIKCENNLNKWFDTIGIIDNNNNKPFLFEIEGKLDSNNNQILLKSAILIGTN